MPDLSFADREVFTRDGHLAPWPLFTREECRRILQYLGTPHPAPADWEKGRAVRERFLFDLAGRPALLDRIRALLGDDIVLWGTSVVRAAPGHRHAWHTDIEASGEGRFVNAWIGIEHTNRDSTLHLISRSHRFGVSVQEARWERGVGRDAATSDILAIAQARDAEAGVVQPEAQDGDVLLFDGKLWHGSHNARTSGTRTALLFQYAAAGSPVRIPDPWQLDWPFRFREAPLAPVILISGTDRSARNRIVPAPPPANSRPGLSKVVHRFDFPLDDPSIAFRPFPAFRGPTSNLADMACHASVLAAGHSPHPPHAHVEEELLIPLLGEIEIVIATSPDDPDPRTERLSSGSFVYYPAWQHHTIRNPGREPVAYLMFKWTATASTAETPMATRVERFASIDAPEGAPPFWTHVITREATAVLTQLQSHLSVVQPGGGYARHVDAHDVAIVPISGVIKTLGSTVKPMDVVYCAAGEAHGLRNPGDKPARYLVFEFHAQAMNALPPLTLRRRVAGRVMRTAKNLARPIWRRVKPFLGR